MEGHSSEAIGLRRLVADLARTRPQDVKAVLDSLTDDQRHIVRGLLDDYIGMGADGAKRSVSPTAGRFKEIDTRGLAPALARRICPQANLVNADSGVSRNVRPVVLEPAWEMTSTALDTLRALAGDLVRDEPVQTIGREHEPALWRRGLRKFGRLGSNSP